MGAAVTQTSLLSLQLHQVLGSGKGKKNQNGSVQEVFNGSDLVWSGFNVQNDRITLTCSCRFLLDHDLLNQAVTKRLLGSIRIDFRMWICY